MRQQEVFAKALLDWYDRHQRTLPWRAVTGEVPDPYRVWLAEVMLQQTTVPTVRGYYERFLARWPTVEALAAAPLDDVLHAWQGLGYYARARNLHACAKAVANLYKGVFPSSETELLALPGIGRYTAAAIAAIAFNKPATVVDGNVERIITRLYRLPKPVAAIKSDIYANAAALTPPQRAGDYAQAMMDLGSTICTPRQPQCGRCPVQGYCAAATAGDVERYPVKVVKPVKPTRYATFYWMVDSAGRVALQRRPEKGLLGGMMEVPSSAWLEEKAAATFPVAGEWQLLPGVIRHTFSHFHLEGGLYRAEVSPLPAYVWVPVPRLGDYALPTVMKKVVRLALLKGDDT